MKISYSNIKKPKIVIVVNDIIDDYILGLLCILANLGFFINIFRILMTKLRAPQSNEPVHYRCLQKQIIISNTQQFICHKVTNSNITNVSYFLSEKPSVPPSSYCLFLVFIGSSHFTVQATQVILMGVDVFGHWLINISLSYQMALKVSSFRSCFATEMERYICHTNLIVTTISLKSGISKGPPKNDFNFP